MSEKKLASLDLTLVIGCKVNCKFCPQNVLVNSYYGKNQERERRLSFENFQKVLNQVEVGATLVFGGMSEPFLNEECADMIVHADKLGYKIALYTTLVGMTRDDYEKVKDVPFDRFVLHIPDKENFSKFDITDEYLEVLRSVCENVSVDFYSCHSEIHPAVMGIVDEKKNSGIAVQNRAGNLEVEGCESYDRKGEIICYRAWSSKEMNVSFNPELLPDGTLLLCCQDYGMKHPLGNLLQQSWDEIRQGEEYKKFYKGLKDDTVDLLCRKCICARTMEVLPPMQLKWHVEGKRAGKADDPKISKPSQELVDRFAAAKNVCAYGLGKLFKEHFFQELWNEGMGVNVLSDINPEHHGTMIRNIPCVSIEKLAGYDGLLVVLFVKNNISEITDNLKKQGINNIITIAEVLDRSTRLCNETNRK